METLGTIIANARKARHLWMKDLVAHIFKEDGHPISIPYLGLIEQDRCKPSPGLIPQLAAVLDIPEDVLYAALGHLPPDIRELLPRATTQQILDAFQVLRKILSSPGEGHYAADEFWRISLSESSMSFAVCQHMPPSNIPYHYGPAARVLTPEREMPPTTNGVALRKRAALYKARKRPLARTPWKGNQGVA